MRRRITDFSIKFNRQSVLDMIDCTADSPIYNATLEELRGLEKEAYVRLNPRAVIALGEIPNLDLAESIASGTKALFTVFTVGKGISDWSTELFSEGDYLGGMLVNAMADDFLFQMDTVLSESVIDMGRSIKMGVGRRVEAPNDISMAAQRLAWEITDAGQEIDVDIMESYMFSPVKSNCVIYLLDKACSEYRTEHDCSTCSVVQCKRRKAACKEKETER